jgi:hypothetical protein
MCVDLLIDISHRQGSPAEELLLLENFPVVGAIVSIPGILMSLVLSIVKVSQAAFHAIKAHDARSQEQGNHQKRKVQLLQDATDWGIILLNQIANLCTVGILNNVLVRIASYKIIRQSTADADL